MQVKITVKQNDRVLTETIAEVEKDGDLAAAVKAELDILRTQNRSAPLWGIQISIDKPD